MYIRCNGCLNRSISKHNNPVRNITEWLYNQGVEGRKSSTPWPACILTTYKSACLAYQVICGGKQIVKCLA